MSLNSVATQTETGGKNIEVEHLAENLKKAQPKKKAQPTTQYLDRKLKHFRFDDESVTFYWIAKFLNINHSFQLY